MNRRKFMFAGLGAGALLAGAAAWMRPADRGGPYDDYFRALNRELKANGPMCPVLLIDLDRLDHNIDVVMRSVRRGGKHLRLVEKSLPSPGLLAYIARRAGTRRLMSFHQPFLNHDAVAFADADILLGKPLPVRSAELFYREHKGAFDPARQLQWLIDTPQRLRQYLALAQGLGTRMRVWTPQLTLNTAGSPSYRMHEKETLSSEVSVGTAMLKPSHYDLASLAEHVPAVYIATPVLKSTGAVQIPALDGKSRLFSWWDPNQRGTFFIYGGNWMADFASPEGLRSNGIYGRSSNQEMVNGSPSVGLEVDDQVFLRPTQSESVLLQFGDLLALRGGRIVERWPVYA